MAVEIRIPELGESLVEATIGRWVKQPGEHVEAGEPVVEIETDKVVMEVAAPESGVIASLNKAEGDTAAVGEVIATLEAGQAAAPAPQAAAPPAAPAATAASPPPSAAPAPSPPPLPGAAAAAGRHASPSVRRLARSLGVELEAVPVSDPRGVVSREDVEAYAAGRGSAAAAAAPAAAGALGDPTPPSPAAAPAPPRAAAAPAPAPARALGSDEETVRMSRRRLTIARQLVTAQQTAAMLTTFNEVDMTAILAVRNERKERFREEHGVGLGFMSFFVTAAVAALKRFERLNAEIRGEDIVLKRHFDIGIAVSTDEGLVVPVLRGADRLAFPEIERAVADLAARARSGSLALEDLRGGTFTITNGGVFGSLFSTPILNPPQVGILGMHAIVERPVAVEGRMEIHPMMYVALSYDHRIVDGSEAVRFLVAVKRMLEDPVRLLLEA
jgi:2-oxoglutarate dehydrogenase E2 component (dihydrolipoamide succinyltransferase)